MTVGANIQGTILPIYATVGRQDSSKKWVFGDYRTTALICMYDRLLPFLIRRPYNTTEIGDLTIYLVNKDTNDYTDITTYFTTGEGIFEIKTTGAIDYILYYGSESLVLPLPRGYYYIVLTDGTNLWETDVMNIVCYKDEGLSAGSDFGSGLLINDIDFLLSGGGGAIAP